MAKSKVAAASGSKPANSSNKLKANIKDAKVSKSETSKNANLSADFEEFPSSDDEDYNEDEEEEEEDFDGFESTDDEKDDEETKPVPQVDQATKTKVESQIKKNKKNQKPQEKEDKTKPRVVYVGRIPHGFYEEQMKAYFSQFGTITRLRLSRNKKTGRSKHYAFVEFESHYAAEAVADVMHGYLLFGHILQVRLMPQEKIHDQLFVGANKTFKAIPWARISKYHNDKPKSQEKWDKLQQKHKEGLKSKMDKLKELGIDYEYSTASPKKTATTKRKTRSSKK